MSDPYLEVRVHDVVDVQVQQPLDHVDGGLEDAHIVEALVCPGGESGEGPDNKSSQQG